MSRTEDRGQRTIEDLVTPKFIASLQKAPVQSDESARLPTVPTYGPLQLLLNTSAYGKLEPEFVSACQTALNKLIDAERERDEFQVTAAKVRAQTLHEAILAVHNSRFYEGLPDCNYNGVRNAERVLREQLGAQLNYPGHSCEPIAAVVSGDTPNKTEAREDD